jgi:hypothetical protein
LTTSHRVVDAGVRSRASDDVIARVLPTMMRATTDDQRARDARVMVAFDDPLASSSVRFRASMSRRSRVEPDASGVPLDPSPGKIFAILRIFY